MCRLLPLLALLALTIPTVAQRRDVRLSPPEPVSYALPDSIRMHAADRIGSVALVVWSSSRRLVDSTFVPCLWGQIVRDSVAVGAPFLVHPEYARPSRSVTVCTSGDRFIVVWNDARRDAIGVYSTLIDTLGALVRPPVRVHASLTNTLFFPAFASADGEVVFFWSTWDGKADRIHARVLDRDGVPITERMTLGTRVTWLRRMTPAVDGYLVCIDAARWYVVGRRIPRLTRVVAPVGDPFVVRDDGTVVTIWGDSVRILASLLDTIQLRSAPVPAIGTLALLVPSPVAVGDTLILVGMTRRDSTGAYIQRLVSVSMNDALEVIGTREIWREVVPYSYDDIRGASGGPIVRIVGCDNRFRLNAALRIVYSGYHQRDEQATVFRDLVLDDRGGAVVDRDTAISTCDPVDAARTIADTLSGIRVGTRVRAAVPTAWRDIDIPQQRPGLVDLAGSVAVTWRTNRTMPCAIWPRYDDTVTVLRDVAPLPPATAGNCGSSEYHTLHRYGDFVAIETGAWTCQWSTLHEYYSQTGFFGIRVMTSNGWKGGGIANCEFSWDRPYYTPSPPLFHPGRRYLAGLVRRYCDSRMPELLYEVDSNGNLQNLIARELRPSDNAVVLPVMPGRYLLLDGVATLQTKNDSSVAFPLSRTNGRASYQRLLGSTFLRHWQDSADRHLLHVELYDVALGLIEAQTIRFDTPVPELSIVQRSADSSMFIVFTADGVRAHRFDSRLNWMWSNVAVSETRDTVTAPAAMVMRDSLVVVWEDYRGTGVDIYGAVMPIDAIPTGIDAPTANSDALIELVAPLPAGGQLEVTLAEDVDVEASVELVDTDGRAHVRSTVDPERRRFRLALERCASGLYLLIVRAGARVDQRPVIVVR